MMSTKNLSLTAVFVLAVSAGIMGLNTNSLSGEGCVTAACHTGLLKAKVVHPIAETCESCHESEVSPHPQKGKKTFKLVQKVPELCAMCHPPFGKKVHVHSPVKNGMCMTCHNAHASNDPKLLLQPVRDLCTTCHSNKVNFKYLHGPTATGDCTTCHSPHESNNVALLVTDGNELCFTCHVDIQEEMTKKVIHPAVMGGCVSCHNPHGSSFRKLLSAEGEKLCFQCHPQISEKVLGSKVVHAPVRSEKACASCHTPHASNNDKLLPKSGKDLCLDCHKNLLKKNMTVLHGPIKDGTCTPCHDPHGALYAKLLVKEFPSAPYVPYTDKEYELCFTCHKRDLLRFPDTSFATGFRDGERNLHYLHVNRVENGRNCKLCHNVHGSDHPKLIAESVPFGRWELPLKFVMTDTGGSCSPGCHKKYSYDRKSAGKAPEPAKEEGKGK